MKKIILITILIFALLSPAAYAFDLKLENTSNKTLIFQFTWLNCDWEGYPKITHMWQGEIQPGATLTSGRSYVPGPYVIRWSSMFYSDDKFSRAYPFIAPIDNDIGIVFSTPMEKPVFIPGT